MKVIRIDIYGDVSVLDSSLVMLVKILCMYDMHGYASYVTVRAGLLALGLR